MNEVEAKNGQNEETPEPEEQGTPAERMGRKLSEAGGMPEWFAPPMQGLKAPPGRRVTIMRFRSQWTNAPEKGERQIVCWPLTEAEEQLAALRARGDDRKVVHELAKQCIRYIDGQRVDWTMTPGAGVTVAPFWDEIGPACRKLVIHYYVKAHTLTEEDQLDFFANCIVSTISIPA